MTAGTIATPGPRRAAHPEWDPLVRLLAITQEALRDPAWTATRPRVTASGDNGTRPVLATAEVVVDGGLAGRLLGRLLSARGPEAADAVLDPLPVLEAAIRHDSEALEYLGHRLGVGPDALRVVASLAATPVLHACRRASTSPAESSAGFCPVCGGWPTLAEARGLERTRQFRCARCGADWAGQWLRCPYCANLDHEHQGALVSERTGESRKVETCEACRGYVKTVTTLGPLAADELALLDLDTVELDIAALEMGYARPPEPGHALEIRLVPA